MASQRRCRIHKVPVVEVVAAGKGRHVSEVTCATMPGMQVLHFTTVEVRWGCTETTHTKLIT